MQIHFRDASGMPVPTMANATITSIKSLPLG
jgi:hypothetical protein